MQGDFSRFTFDPTQHFLRVLMQQGRVQVDADWNEQAAILLHYLQSLAADLIGDHGGPGDSFQINPRTDAPNAGRLDFRIEPGHYYVDGILCENEGDPATYYTEQADYPWTEGQDNVGSRHLVYLDVWERPITYLQNEMIREVALGGPDTSARSQVVWQVKTARISSDVSCNNLPWETLVESWQPANRGRLKARAKVTEEIDATNPCVLPPDARYRGAENQLYRVEIHRVETSPPAAWFKWSRENGAVVFPIVGIAERVVELAHLGMDDCRSLQEGDWVEIVDDIATLRNEPPLLRKVESINRVRLEVTLDKAPTEETGREQTQHPFLRRWDHRERAQNADAPAVSEKGVLIKEGTGEVNWMALEDGVQIQFQPGATYRPGDYWLIPARTATGDVLWPQENNGAKALKPHGITHHYAPLAIVTLDDNGNTDVQSDCRCRLLSLCEMSAFFRRQEQ